MGAYLTDRLWKSHINRSQKQGRSIMSTHIILVTPEFMKAELQARYGAPSRRRPRRVSSLRVQMRAHRRRTDEANRLARTALAH